MTGARGPDSPCVVRSEAVSFELPSEGPATIAVVADTHSRPHPRALEWLAARRCALVLHAGDIGDPAVVDALAAHAPTLAVRGNIDDHALPDDRVITLTRGGAPALRLLLTHIAVNGPRLRADVRARARAADAQLVACGHSHVPFIGRDGALTVLNPGSIGPRRFQLPITFAVITVAEGKVQLAHVDAETLEPWRPRA